MKRIPLFMMVLICGFAVAAAASNKSKPSVAKAVIGGTATNSIIIGAAKLVEEKGGVTIDAQVANVPPGKHGFHIHENGSCADEGKAAGGHFNPDAVMHGYMPKDGHKHSHLGDMGNVEIGSDGMGIVHVFLPKASLSKGKYNVMGRAIILHEKEDDFGQPTGNAGGRIACGVIEQQ